VIRKVIAVIVIGIAGVAALLIVARPPFDPDHIVGYWRLDSGGDLTPGPALIRVDKSADGTSFTVAGVTSPTGEFLSLSPDVMSTVSVDDQGVLLDTVAGSPGGSGDAKLVRLEPDSSGTTLSLAIIPFEEDRSGVPDVKWQFTRATGDPAQLAAELESQVTPAASAAPTPAP
jgi:hypothetical protein